MGGSKQRGVRGTDITERVVAKKEGGEKFLFLLKKLKKKTNTTQHKAAWARARASELLQFL